MWWKCSFATWVNFPSPTTFKSQIINPKISTNISLCKRNLFNLLSRDVILHFPFGNISLVDCLHLFFENDELRFLSNFAMWNFTHNSCESSSYALGTIKSKSSPILVSQDFMNFLWHVQNSWELHNEKFVTLLPFVSRMSIWILLWKHEK